jgi:hypothetical protein
MQHINSADKLKATISELEQKRALEKRMLKEQSLEAYDSIKPVNLIRSAVQDVAETPDLQDRLINATAALVAGSLSNLIFQGVSHSPLKKLVGTVIQFGVTKIIVDNPEVVKAIGLGIYKLITHKSRKENKRMQYIDTK